MRKLPRIISNQDICHGKPVIEGTRVMVWQILELLGAGQTHKDIYREFPTLPKKAIEAALHYAAERTKAERYVSFNSQARDQVFT